MTPLSALLLWFMAARPAAAQLDVRSAYLDIVSQYHRGDDDAGAIVGLSLMPIDNVEDQVFRDLDRLIARAGSPGDDDVRQLGPEQRLRLAGAWSTLVPAAAVLHVETGRHLLNGDEDKAGLRHLVIARRLVDWPRWSFVHATLRSQADERRHAEIRRDVYLAIAWILQHYVQAVPLTDHLAKARAAFPDDAEVWLASGSAAELRADVSRARLLTPPPDTRMVGAWRRITRSAILEEAERYYREAIARQATLAEAHLRLGRVLHQRERLPDARRALETARDLKPVAEIGYLAALFLARLTEEEGDEASAFTQYADIVRRWPDCHAAQIGLSRMFDGRGDRQAAFGALQPLLREREDRACPIDPWWMYIYGQAWRLVPLLETLRARVKP